MNMIKARRLPLLLLFALLVGIGLQASTALAQAPGSTATYGGTVTISGIQNDAAESLYLGPGAYTIDGTWTIYSKNVWIAPTATFTGAGKIIFNNPSDAGGASSATLIDGNNGTFIDVKIEMNNMSHMILTDLADPGFGTVNPAGALAAALKIGKDFNFTATDASDINGGHLTLNGNDFVFDPDATVSGYRTTRYVDTGNSIAGHMVKQFDASTSSFTFPVGYVPSNYPYEPARITASSGTFHVSVQDMDASVSDESVIDLGPNIERTWHIYADAPTPATIDLQNDGGVGSNGWDETAPHCVVRWQGGTSWETNTNAPGSLPTLTTGGVITNGSIRSVTTTVVGSSSNTLSYYTKFEGPDLTPIISALPSTQYGTTNFTVVVDVFELNNMDTNSPITVYVTKDPLVNLSFNNSSVLVGGKLVQNSIWTFDNTDPNFYILTTNEVISGEGNKSFGLTGVLTPGNTQGTLNISTTIVGESGGEMRIDNNADADKIDYFKK